MRTRLWRTNSWNGKSGCCSDLYAASADGLSPRPFTTCSLSSSLQRLNPWPGASFPNGCRLTTNPRLYETALSMLLRTAPPDQKAGTVDVRCDGADHGG